MEISNEEYEGRLENFEEELTKLIEMFDLDEVAGTSSFVLSSHLTSELNNLVDSFITHNNYKS